MIQFRVPLTSVCLGALGFFLLALATLAGTDVFHPFGIIVVPTPNSLSDEHYHLAHSLAERNHFGEAIPECRRAISLNPVPVRYYNLLGYCLQKVGQYDEAIQTCDRILLWAPLDAYAYRTLGICLYHKGDFQLAADSLQRCVWWDSKDFFGSLWLGYALYHLNHYPEATRSFKRAVDLRPKDFLANYWYGVSSFSAKQFEQASESLAKAVELKPRDFEANFWRGMSLARVGKFGDAIPNFEKAHEIRGDDNRARFQLFVCYFATQQPQKALQIYPAMVGVVGGAFIFIYLIGLAVLLCFSLPIRAPAFPGLRFSIAWLALFFEGQIAFLLVLALFPWLGENVFAGIVLAGLPVIVMAITGFARQPWGEPFRWPLRFGTWKIIAQSLAFLLLLGLISAAFSQLYAQIMHKPAPLQNTIPLVKGALRANPVIAWLAIPVIIPGIEEILFRGLLYGALEKRWGVKGAILGSAFLFACVHFQLIGFLYLFCFGVILGWARGQSRSLGLPIVIHSFNNAAALLALTLSSQG